ncbi:hypothetical protein [Paracoccus sp. (in: a-proteobacteria)]|uniref:hypothetical protein n=1 Tax=Paracoccus sp. TaxID=267 RepID=UPI00272C71AF|nr:hypothetical protein [Paracoccus sp. (in: a-proteobacteria)]
MNLAHPAAFSAFRELLSHGAIMGNRTPLCDGLTLHADPALQLGGEWRSPSGRVLELALRPRAAGAWLGLHLALDLPDLAGLRFLGLAARAVAPDEVLIRACLRSGLPEGGFRDHFMPRHWLAHDEAATHHDLIHLPSQNALPVQAPWRELVLFLPCRPLDLHLHDLAILSA